MQPTRSSFVRTQLCALSSTFEAHTFAAEPYSRETHMSSWAYSLSSQFPRRPRHRRDACVAHFCDLDHNNLICRPQQILSLHFCDLDCRNPPSSHRSFRPTQLRTSPSIMLLKRSPYMEELQDDWELTMDDLIKEVQRNLQRMNHYLGALNEH